jgi:hypothetical protein
MFQVKGQFMSATIIQFPVRSRWSAKRVYRLTRTIVVGLLNIWAATGFFANQSASAVSANAHIHFAYVTVLPGQSLWSIAEKHAPNQDPSEFVQQIMQLNNLQTANVSIGQKLAIPNSN